jgi:hypothetical protein
VYRSDLAPKSGKQVCHEVPGNFMRRTSESVNNTADKHLARRIPLYIDRTLCVAAKLGPASPSAPSFAFCGVQFELSEFRVSGDSAPEGLALV